MIDPHFENRSGSRSGHYSRWPDPWRREDDWGRSPPRLCFSLSWLVLSPTAAAFPFRSLCSGLFRPPRWMHRTRRKPPAFVRQSWRRSSLWSFDIGLRCPSLNFLDSVVRTSRRARIQLGGEARDRHI